MAAQVNLVTQAPAPHLLYVALRDGGPPASIGLGAPDQGADQRPNGLIRGEINLTKPTTEHL
jgi:hypothetical protein